MTELEDKFSKILEQMNTVIDLHKRGLMSKSDAHTRLFILSREVEILALGVNNKEAGVEG